MEPDQRRASEDHRMKRALERLPSWLRAVYRPEPIQAWIGPVWTIIAAYTAFGRAADYLSRQPPHEGVYEVVAYLGFPTWGVLFGIVSAFCVIGLLSRGLFPIVLAHVFGTAVYVSFLLSLVIGVIAIHNLGLDTTPANRAVSFAVGGTIMHLLRTVSLLPSIRAAAKRTPDRRA
jgi:hypothetical protein